MKGTLISLCVVVFFVACGTEPIEEISVNKRNSSFTSWENDIPYLPQDITICYDCPHLCDKP